MTLRIYPEPVHFCWICEVELAGDEINDTHYLDGHTIYFCCEDHKGLHAEFASF